MKFIVLDIVIPARVQSQAQFATVKNMGWREARNGKK
jgi:hypothetical protein